MLTASALAIVLPSLLFTVASTPAPPGCALIDGKGRCLVAAVDPGRPGGPRDSDHGSPNTQTRARPKTAKVPTAPQPPPVAALPLGNGGWAVGEEPAPGDVVDPVPGTNRRAGAPAAVTPEVLAQQALELLTLEPPFLHTSAQDNAFVGVPLWLWIDARDLYTGPVSATATAGAASVTAVGRLTSVEWAMGPPGATIRCLGPGTPWSGQDGPSPDCGYIYEQRSLPERTDGTGRWTITATSVWTVTWSGTTNGSPIGGEQIVRVSTDTSLAVGEVQVLVGGEGQ